MADQHPVEFLFEKMKMVEPYPPGVVRIEEEIPGLAFFPGGYGLWEKKVHELPPPFPVGGVMVVGHNFDCVTGYRRSLEAGTERSTSPTWGPLVRVLQRAGVSLASCFFTNAYMGLKAGDEPQGHFPGSEDPGFVKRSAAFLVQQIQVQRPRVLLVLGLPAIRVVASASVDLEPWKRIGSLADLCLLDQQGKSPVALAHFEGLECHVRAAIMVHPCNRHLNARGRLFGGVKGSDAEVAMLKAILDAADAGQTPPRLAENNLSVGATLGATDQTLI